MATLAECVIVAMIFRAARGRVFGHNLGPGSLKAIAGVLSLVRGVL